MDNLLPVKPFQETLHAGMCGPASLKMILGYYEMEKNFVWVGDYVLQGDLIAYIGNTGNTHGPTGCHLHFDVLGARNPFVR